MIDWYTQSLSLEAFIGCDPLIRVNGKRPLDASWPTGPAAQPNEWRDRLAGHKQNCGVTTGRGIVVVDVDSYKAGADDSLARLFRQGLPKKTPTVMTGGGGTHLYYRTSTPVGSGPLDGYPGIDIKGEGGYVVAPGSTHPETGNTYEWRDGHSPADLELAVLPDGLLPAFQQSGNMAPGELDDRDQTAVELLERFGGHSARNRGTYIEMTRPGKHGRDGASATIGAVGRGTVKVWSPNWPQLSAGIYSLSDLRRIAGVNAPDLEVAELEPPAGYRWWEHGDTDPQPPAPTLGQDAYHGPLGEYLEHLEGRTEAHPAAVGFYTLVYLGASVNTHVEFVAGDEVHHPRIWGALTGSTSSGRKGVAIRTGRRLVDLIEPGLVDRVSATGFGSGEALIDHVKDELTDEDREAGRQEPMKPRVFEDSELGGVLRVCRREGSILSEQLRKAYDGDVLSNRTRTSGVLNASAHHIGTIGAITPAELLSLLDDVLIHNGYVNRTLWLHTERTASLPFGGNLDAELVGRVADSIANGYARCATRFELQPGTDAGNVWADFYAERQDGITSHGHIVEAITSRHISHCARIALMYAVMDGAAELQPEHIRAGIAWCDYSAATVIRLFGAESGNVIGDERRLLEAIREAMPAGLTGTEQRQVFHSNRSREELDGYRAELTRLGLIHTITETTGGRPAVRSFALHSDAGSLNSETWKGSKGSKVPVEIDFPTFKSFPRSRVTHPDEMGEEQ